MLVTAKSSLDVDNLRNFLVSFLEPVMGQDGYYQGRTIDIQTSDIELPTLREFFSFFSDDVNFDCLFPLTSLLTDSYSTILQFNITSSSQPNRYPLILKFIIFRNYSDGKYYPCFRCELSDSGGYDLWNYRTNFSLYLNNEVPKLTIRYANNTYRGINRPQDIIPTYYDTCIISPGYSQFNLPKLLDCYVGGTDIDLKYFTYKFRFRDYDDNLKELSNTENFNAFSSVAFAYSPFKRFYGYESFSLSSIDVKFRIFVDDVEYNFDNSGMNTGSNYYGLVSVNKAVFVRVDCRLSTLTFRYVFDENVEFPSITNPTDHYINGAIQAILENLEVLNDCCQEMKGIDTDMIDYSQYFDNINTNLALIASCLQTTGQDPTNITDVLKSGEGVTNLVQIDEACPPFGRGRRY